MSPRVTRIWTVLFAMVLCAPAVSAATAPPAHAAHATTAGAMPSPDAVLAALKAGNERHAKHQYTHPHQSAARSARRSPVGRRRVTCRRWST